MAICLARFAALAEISGDNKRAARLLGATLALRPGSKTEMPSHLRDEFEGQVAAMREVMGDEIFERAYAAGAAMSLDEATAYALEEIGYS